MANEAVSRKRSRTDQPTPKIPPPPCKPTFTCFHTEPPTDPDLAFRGPLPPRTPIMTPEVIGTVAPPPPKIRHALREVIVADLSRDERHESAPPRPMRATSRKARPRGRAAPR